GLHPDGVRPGRAHPVQAHRRRRAGARRGADDAAGTGRRRGRQGVTRATMIVNPASANGRTRKQWPDIASRAQAHGIEPDVALTEGPGHATELAAAAVSAGAELVVAVGGDGTVSEVANGMVGAPATELAVVQRGSGCDFSRTFGIPKN